MRVNDVGSCPPLSDTIMATNQARMAIKMDDSCFLKGWLKKFNFVVQYFDINDNISENSP